MSRPYYETTSIRGSDKRLYILMAQGFKRCNKCGVMVKHDGKFCPMCGSQFAMRFMYKSIAEVKKNVEEERKRLNLIS